MNIGQVLETHLGWVARVLGFRALTPVFDGADDVAIEDGLARAWLAQQSGAAVLDPGKRARPRSDIDAAKAWINERKYDGEQVFGEDHPGVAREVCLRIWLEELGVASRDMPAEELSRVAVEDRPARTTCRRRSWARPSSATASPASRSTSR